MVATFLSVTAQACFNQREFKKKGGEGSWVRKDEGLAVSEHNFALSDFYELGSSAPDGLSFRFKIGFVLFYPPFSNLCHSIQLA